MTSNNGIESQGTVCPTCGKPGVKQTIESRIYFMHNSLELGCGQSSRVKSCVTMSRIDSTKQSFTKPAETN
ncbi:MAG TPA: hypothetical protein VGF44_03265 [Terriglobales bacterium]